MTTSIFKLLCTADTKLLRLCFAIVSVTWASWLILDPNINVTHPILQVLGPSPYISTLFLVYSSALIYGVKTAHYSLSMLFIEGIMGTFLWVGSGILDSIQHQTLSPPLVGGLIALYLLIRYPTHYTGGPDAH